jgi:hypothetical protein
MIVSGMAANAPQVRGELDRGRGYLFTSGAAFCPGIFRADGSGSLAEGEQAGDFRDRSRLPGDANPCFQVVASIRFSVGICRLTSRRTQLELNQTVTETPTRESRADDPKVVNGQKEMSVRKTLENPEEQNHPEKPLWRYPSSLFFGAPEGANGVRPCAIGPAEIKDPP